MLALSEFEAMLSSVIQEVMKTMDFSNLLLGMNKPTIFVGIV